MSKKSHQAPDRVVFQITDKIGIAQVKLGIDYYWIDDGVIKNHNHWQKIYLNEQITQIELNIPHKIHNLVNVYVKVLDHGCPSLYKFDYYVPKEKNGINKLLLTHGTNHHIVILNNHCATDRFSHPSCQIL